MHHSSRRRSAVQDALQEVLRRTAPLPASPERDAIRNKAEEYLRERAGWSASSPAPAEKEQMMKRVLALHLEIAKIERSIAGN